MNREIRLVCDQETLEELIGVLKVASLHTVVGGDIDLADKIRNSTNQLESELVRQFIEFSDEV